MINVMLFRFEGDRRTTPGGSCGQCHSSEEYRYSPRGRQDPREYRRYAEGTDAIEEHQWRFNSGARDSTEQSPRARSQPERVEYRCAARGETQR